ncbi:hypothetical protein HGH92_26520 [Chitinophaga varians]|uniref:Uncharacterized protein n=1 Tax=Chitinophaga varians TaxID=2202339 RepID=A0A847S4X0_9BACT|nr:hypothetical protein [Chitinophaga varians]NLR67887.1 hypothetical protein [Chitinophaga varians]
MDGIKFTDRRGRIVEVSKPHGAGGNSYYVTVNRFHYGQIVRVLGGEWVAYPNSDDLPPAYWNALVDWVSDRENKKDEEGG